MTAAHVSLTELSVPVGQSLTAIGRKNAPADLFQRRRDPGQFPAVDADLAGSATPDEAHMYTIKVGDIVQPPGDYRPWRVLDLYQGKAQIEFVGEAWARIKTVPAGDLRLDLCERSTFMSA